jgi:APA family basic amino acid/polyamine antiporter
VAPELELPQPANSSHGLLRTIGRWSLTALMVNSIIGVSIFRLPADLAGKLGALSPWSCVGAGAGILIIAGCIAEVSSRYGQTGGLYLYARDALGQFPGLVVAWLTWLTRIAAPAAAANLFCSYIARFVPVLGTRVGELFALVLLIGSLALFNFFGVKTGGIVSNFFTAVKVGFLLFFVAAGLLAWLTRPEIRVPLTAPATTFQDWFSAMLLLVYAYGGFEGALFVGGETKNPQRDTPIALMLALLGVCVVYTAVQFVTIATLPNASGSTAPLADAAQRFLGGIGGAAITLGALVSAFGYLSANLLHSPRIAFALAEHGEFPSALAAIHAKYRTPYVSIFVYAALVIAFAALGNFKWNAVLSAASRLAVYGAMAVAVPVLRSRNAGKATFRLPMVWFFVGAALLYCVVLLMQMGRGEFAVIAITWAIAAVNWFAVRR